MLYLRPLQPSVWGLMSAKNAPETPKKIGINSVPSSTNFSNKILHQGLKLRNARFLERVHFVSFFNYLFTYLSPEVGFFELAYTVQRGDSRTLPMTPLRSSPSLCITVAMPDSLITNDFFPLTPYRPKQLSNITTHLIPDIT